MNAIQEERMRGYFITAAKELIRGEGIAVVSARNVAERAGYSYATLYNYFKDIRDLIFNCVEGFMEECREFVMGQIPADISGEALLIAKSRSYFNFFVQYPGIFDLFYHEKVNQIATANSRFEKVSSFFDSLVESEWEVIKEQNGVKEETIAMAGSFLKPALHGLLLFYLNKRIADEYGVVIKRVDELVRFAVRVS